MAKNKFCLTVDAGAQVRIDKQIDITIEHGTDVAGFDLGAQILDQLIRLQDIGADLVAPGVVAWRTPHACSARRLDLKIIQACFQDAHRIGFVLVLRTLTLADYHNPGFQMRQTHGTIGTVDVLTAGTAGAEGVNAQIAVGNDDIDIIIDFRQDIDRSKGSMAAFVGGSNRYAHPGEPLLRPKISIGKFAGYGQRDVFGSGFVARLDIRNLIREAILSSQRVYIR